MPTLDLFSGSATEDWHGQNYLCSWVFYRINLSQAPNKISVSLISVENKIREKDFTMTVDGVFTFVIEMVVYVIVESMYCTGSISWYVFIQKRPTVLCHDRQLGETTQRGSRGMSSLLRIVPFLLSCSLWTKNVLGVIWNHVQELLCSKQYFSKINIKKFINKVWNEEKTTYSR